MKTKGFAPILVAIVVAIIVIGGVSLLIATKKQNTVLNQNPAPGNQSTPSPINTDIKNWSTYTNDEYGFEFKHPTELSILASNSGDSPIEHRVCLMNTRAEQCNNQSIQVSIAEKNDKNKSYITDLDKRSQGYSSLIAENNNYIFRFTAKTDQGEILNKVFSGFKTIPQTSVSKEWKTYVNDEYGFELRYPVYFGQFQKTGTNKWKAENKPLPSKTATLELKVHPYKSTLVLFDNYGSELKFDSQRDQFYTTDKGYKEKKLLDGRSYTSESVGEGGDGWWGFYSAFFVFDKNKNVMIELGTPGNPNTYNKGLKLEEIFSTLKFTK